MAVIDQEKQSNDSSVNSLTNSCDELIKSTSFIPIRFTIVALSLGCSMILFFTRLNLSVAIVSMVNHAALHDQQNNQSSSKILRFIEAFEEKSCPTSNNDSVNGNQVLKSGEFVWDESTQGIILASYFYGHTISQIIGGRLSERFGGKWPIFYGTAIPFVCTMLTPLSARQGIIYLSSNRAIIGFFHGFLLSGIYALFSQWIPKSERATAYALLNMGGAIGAAIIMPLTAMLCELRFLDDFGWPLAFYVPGLTSLVWMLPWVIISSDRPDENRFISESELRYIKKNIDTIPKKAIGVPWKKILFCKAIWGILTVKVCSAVGYFVLQSKLPDYLESVLHVDMTENGLLNALLYVASIASPLIAGPLSDFILRREILSTTVVRKLFHTFAVLGFAICLFLIPVAGCDITFLSILLLVSMFVLGFNCAGDSPMFGEIAPAFTGTIFGFANTFSSAIGFITPMFIGFMLDGKHGSRVVWTQIFFLSGGLCIIGIIVFDLLATSETQPWGVSVITQDNSVEEDNDKNIDEDGHKDEKD